MSWRTHARLIVVVVALCALALVAVAPGATASTEELDSSEDNGAEGRTNGLNGEHLAPPDACRGTSEDGSRLERRIPDGPHRDDGSLAFVSGVCVYLPPGYDGGDLRYPMLFVLHGGGGDQSDWVQHGDIQRILDDAYAADPADAVIAVMPDGDDPAVWYDRIDGAHLGETYVNDDLVEFFDTHYRTIGDRTGRAVVGLSNGGFGALHLAATRPDLYSAAGSMSGNVAYRGSENGGFGDQDDAPFAEGQRPRNLVGNLDHVDLILDLGTDCVSDLSVDLCGSWAFEQLFRYDNDDLVAQLEAQGHAGEVDVGWPEEGGHAWRWWMEWLSERHLPFVLERLDDPTASPDALPGLPAPFRYRSVRPAFEAWGYDVRVEREAPWAWLDLTEVTAAGLTIAGDGTATITTAARYKPRAPHTVTVGDGPPSRVRADHAGRLTIAVPLSAGDPVEVTISGPGNSGPTA